MSMSQKGKDGVTLPLENWGKAPDSAPGREVRQSRSLTGRLLLFVLALGLGTAGGVIIRPTLRAPSAPARTESPQPVPATGAEPTDDRQSSEIARLDVLALGRLIPDGGTLAVALPNGAGDARIERLLVSEGDRVEVGQVIAELDNLPQLLALKAGASAALITQEAALEQVRAASLASLEEARANQSIAHAARVLAGQELARLTKLAGHSMTTQALVQQAQSNWAKAAAESERASALVKRYRGAESGMQPDIKLAARSLDMARTNLARAHHAIASGRVVAPRAGTVLEVHARVGEKPSDKGVMTIGDVTRMTAELDVYQTDIRRVSPGRRVTMATPALTAPLVGRVTKIGQIVRRQSMMSTEPAANADARVVRVTVWLDAESSARARAYTNLEVVARIGTGVE